MNEEVVRGSKLSVRGLMLGILVMLLLPICASLTAAATIDLSGRWQFALDPHDQGMASNYWSAIPPAGVYEDTIHLPGTTAQAHKGNPLTLKPVLKAPPPEHFNPRHGLTFGRDKSALENSPLAHLYQRYSYLGPAWYRRSVDIPKNWKGKDVELVLERVIWESRVWVNGKFIGARNSLTTPHRYELATALKPGRNEIVIRIDNRRQAAIGNPHAYTEEAQSIWNGVVGRIALEARAKVRVAHLELRPDLPRHGVEVTVQTHNGTRGTLAEELVLQAAPANFKGHPRPALRSRVSLAPGDSVHSVFYPLGTNFELWSEFNPKLYRMKAALEPGAGRSPASVDSAGASLKPTRSHDGRDACIASSGTFGMRAFKAAGHRFTINGLPTFLRGTVECCVFPKTGYPDMTGGQWEKMFSIMKACGLNHMRFHTWCPPEAAFELADRYGIYLEVELPNWCFHIGRDPAVTDFLRREGERMIREYGNHPSWVMFTMGNELKGDYTVLDGLENHFRKIDPQLLYDSTTYPSSSRGKVPEPADDYYISQDTPCGVTRGQRLFNSRPPSTDNDYAKDIACIGVPLISHEVGQYCVYPDLSELPKYDGVLRDVAYEAIRADLREKGRLGEAARYTRDSGKLAVQLYKEEIERALRTTNQAGFQLLELEDFPGQGTSPVGLLDAFWDSKGLITPAEFHRFCGPVVPLIRMPRRVYQNDEVFDARVEIANFGPAPLQDRTFTWSIARGKREIAEGAFRPVTVPLGNGIVLGRIRQPLSGLTRATRLAVSVTLPGSSIGNSWSIWVYPAAEPVANTNGIAIFQSANRAFYQALQAGKRVLLLPARADVNAPLAARFVPVFWNPVMFPNQPGTMGAMIDAQHPVFADFPTEPWTDWQWWGLLSHSFAINLDALRAPPEMPLRFVDKFNRNALPAAIFEAKVGRGRLLVCTLDIAGRLDRRVAARQLRRSILDYMAGDRFHPRQRLTPAGLKSLFRGDQ